jgi:hypothetical protein
MSVTTATIQAAYRAARAMIPGATISVRHVATGIVYSGIRSALTIDMALSDMGELQGADGAVRLDVSELREPHPKAGDLVEIIETEQGEPLQRYVRSVMYDSLRGTCRLMYGPEYG